jgi:hypothetical protein
VSCCRVFAEYNLIAGQDVCSHLRPYPKRKINKAV